MAFSPVFHLLKKFTVDLSGHAPEAENASERDIDVAGAYSGIDTSAMPSNERMEAIRIELREQNRFLTAHLRDDDIEKSNFYRRSLFVREVVANNRTSKTKP